MQAWRASVRVLRPTARRCYRTKSVTTTPKTTKPSSPTELSKPTSPAAPQGSKHHHDLPSFLKYAERTDSSTSSTVYIGTHYEYTVIETLQRWGFDLTRTGRASDLGIDLVGTWKVPSTPLPISTIVQCKARSKKIGPENVRELEGAFSGAPVGWRAKGTFIFLVAAEPATKGVREALIKSSFPLGFMQIARQGKVQQCLWNRVAGETGLAGMGVTLKYSASTASASRGSTGVDPASVTDTTGIRAREESEAVLTWNGDIMSNEETRVKTIRGRKVTIKVTEPAEGSRPRGRPRKTKDTSEAACLAKAGRPRGRPRKSKEERMIEEK